MQLEDLECVVALDERGIGHIILRSDHIREIDLLMEDTTEDNGFDHWDTGLNAGLYKLKLKAWARQDYEGGWDGGVKVVKITPLWQAPTDD